jgi:AcrR family transcriptional regulator
MERELPQAEQDPREQVADEERAREADPDEAPRERRVGDPGSRELPVAGRPPRERRDAARNREAILAAAQRLFDREGPAAVSMERVADEAGVGKGTIYRRFGDRASLATALLDASERELQESLIRGSPPLGPGAPAVERLVAFGHAWLDVLVRHGDIVLASEHGPVGTRFRSAVYASHRAHLILLLREARPDADADYLADALLAALGSELVLFLRTDRGMDLDRVKGGWSELVRSVAGESANRR